MTSKKVYRIWAPELEQAIDNIRRRLDATITFDRDERPKISIDSLSIRGNVSKIAVEWDAFNAINVVQRPNRQATSFRISVDAEIFPISIAMLVSASDFQKIPVLARARGRSTSAMFARCFVKGSDPMERSLSFSYEIGCAATDARLVVKRQEDSLLEAECDYDLILGKEIDADDMLRAAKIAGQMISSIIRSQVSSFYGRPAAEQVKTLLDDIGNCVNAVREQNVH